MLIGVEKLYYSLYKTHNLLKGLQREILHLEKSSLPLELVAFFWRSSMIFTPILKENNLSAPAYNMVWALSAI